MFSHTLLLPHSLKQNYEIGYIRAILGPTNTGKTHHALTRMMAYKTGIMGFPLRLLARENYNRLVDIKGEENVALLTGEEKIIPKNPKWYCCTVEAMPTDLSVDFIGVDEIQLASDPERGHIFTEKLLHARGRNETIFLGAETMRPILEKLIKNINVEIRPRLSQLIATGATNLIRLPPRSAIVAFSATELYRIAETIRQRKGGCALIMGRLSPRTRNAQIELYQNRDVDYLIATDAIGMGLNMDVNHVALSALQKFDGMTTRSLSTQEIAQISGRAGRGMKDGTFGTTGHCPPMPESMYMAIENHKFETIKTIYWRNEKLNFSHPYALLKSLNKASPRPELIRGRTSSDVEVLTILNRSEDIKALAKGPDAVKLLWESCQIPDFKKIGYESHAFLCGNIFKYLYKNSHIPDQWMDTQLKRLKQIKGDFDTLMQRLAGVRICAYIAARQGWMHKSEHWQECCAHVEDFLSDALHEKLMARFVNKRASILLKHHHHAISPDFITPNGDLMIENHKIGEIAGFSVKIDKTKDKIEEQILNRTAHKAIISLIPKKIEIFKNKTEKDIQINNIGDIFWENSKIACLIKGDSFFIPEIKIVNTDHQTPQQTLQIKNHLKKIVFKNFFAYILKLQKKQNMPHISPQLRGLIYRLLENGGRIEKCSSDISLFKNKQLKKAHISQTPLFFYFDFITRPSTNQPLTVLQNIWHNTSYKIPSYQKISIKNSYEYNPAWFKAGSIIIRIDIIKKLFTLLEQKKGNIFPAPLHIETILGIKKRFLYEILSGLSISYRKPTSLNKNIYGPPQPLIIIKQKNKKYKKQKKRYINPFFEKLSQWKTQ